MIDEYRDINAYKSEEFSGFLTKVFGIMAIGLIVSAISAFFSIFSLVNGGIVYKFLIGTGSFGMIILGIAEIVTAVYLSSKLFSMSKRRAWILYIAYAWITGLSFGIFPLIYGVGTIFLAFGYSAILFISMAVIGYTTKADLSKFSSLLSAGLITLLIASLISIFLDIRGLDLFISYAGIIVFLGITAFDIQKIKADYYNYSDKDILDKLGIFGAFMLYLDLINIFLDVLSILGRKDNNN